MLDAGSSEAHARLFLDSLVDEGVAPPSAVALTHSHWDHVFGAAALDAQVIAHTLTAEALDELAPTDWSDEALDHRVATGRVSSEHAANVKAELPAPREVRVAPADIVFRDGLDIELGNVSVRVRHVGGDHAADSSVMFVEPDRVLFLGDCLYDSPDGRLTSALALPLLDAVLDFGAEQYVEGHSETVISPAELEGMADKVRLAERLVRGLSSEGSESRRGDRACERTRGNGRGAGRRHGVRRSRVHRRLRRLRAPGSTPRAKWCALISSPAFK